MAKIVSNVVYFAMGCVGTNRWLGDVEVRPSRIFVPTHSTGARDLIEAGSTNRLFNDIHG
jgi:hypothetical protein